MKKRKQLALALCFALFLIVPLSAWAAVVPTVTQSFELKAGWNAVYLEVQPVANSPAVVFKTLPVGSSVWAWQGKNTPVQFIQNPGELTVNNPNWLAAFTSPAESHLNNLHAITANSAYLIQVPAGIPPLTINIAGRPTMRHKSWIPDSFNLIGFGFSSTPPTFASFFAPSNSHKNQAIYRLNNSSGLWEIINNPATANMRSGEAFWIYCQSGSDYQGPLSIEADNADGLDFGAGIDVLRLTLFNTSAINRTVSVTQTTPNALAYRHYDATEGLIHTHLLSTMPPVTVKAGGSSVITLAVQRSSFSGSLASVLEFSDGQGSRVRVPVTARSNVVNGNGLWSGVATLNKVSLVSDTNTDPLAKPTPPSAEMNLSLILHQDSGNQVRLLKQVIMMYQEAAATPGAKGRYVLLTNDKLIPNYKGVAQRDGAGVGRRLSAVWYDYSPGPDTDSDAKFDNTALKCSGTISPAGTIVCKLVLESSSSFTHPTNPFLHRYHPDHDNLGNDYKAFKQEVNRIERTMTLTFDSTPQENPDNPPVGWGVSVLGGTFTESVSGLARGPIKVQGTFTIKLASEVDRLNE